MRGKPGPHIMAQRFRDSAALLARGIDLLQSGHAVTGEGDERFTHAEYGQLARTRRAYGPACSAFALAQAGASVARNDLEGARIDEAARLFAQAWQYHGEYIELAQRLVGKEHCVRCGQSGHASIDCRVYPQKPTWHITES